MIDIKNYGGTSVVKMIDELKSEIREDKLNNLGI
jgi:hypothetical protein